MIHNDISGIRPRSVTALPDPLDPHLIKVVLVQVLIPRPLKNVLTYRLVYHHVEDAPKLGECVWVPLGAQEVIGCLWDISSHQLTQDHLARSSRVKDVILRLRWLPVLPRSLRQLIDQIARYYHVTLGEALHLALPSFNLQRGFLFTHPEELALAQSLVVSSDHDSETLPVVQDQLSLFDDFIHTKDPSLSDRKLKQKNEVESVDLISRSMSIQSETVTSEKKYDVPNTEQEAELNDALLSVLNELSIWGPLIYQKLPLYVSKNEWADLIRRGILRELKVPRRRTSEVYLFSAVEDRVWPAQRRERVERKVFEHLQSCQERLIHRVTLQELGEAQLCTSMSRLKRALRCLIELDLVTYHVDMAYLQSPVEDHLDDASPSFQEHLCGGQGIEDSPSSTTEDFIKLTTEQNEAVAEVKASTGFQAFLLHGVTGSGKTEVYLTLIEEVLKQGGQALVLLPEIGLTPQTVRRFKMRLHASIYTWHSQLSGSERVETWHEVGQLNPCVLIGARSALFAPLPNLQIIIIDESHDGSYKQGEGVRYHARDMAIFRASFVGCPIILGSATPSLESMYNAQQGKYRLLQLTERPQGATLPRVRTVDLTTSRAISPTAPALTHTLAQAITERMKRKEQVILFLNRRGFSQSVRCTDCGFLFACPQCVLALPWHQHTQRLQCHHCDFSSALPTTCPRCNSVQAFAPIGKGTERIEEQLQTLFPQAKIARLDRDSSLKSQSLHQLMHDGQIDILIGTQMVTKGHDFPRVTLVGVIDADVGLDLPDFRVNERSYQLLSQVAGRAGRAALKGEVIVQTYRPQEERLLAAITHDYGRFYLHELYLRQAIGYPPFGYLATLRLQADVSLNLQVPLECICESLKDPGEVRVRGPSLAPLSQLQGQQRWIVLLISVNRRALHHLLSHLKNRLGRTLGGARLLIDVDPHDFT